MGLRRFDRIYYSIEKSGSQTLIYPFTRIRYDEKTQSPVIQKPLNQGEPITVELWQMAEQSDIDEYQWGEPTPITTDKLIEELILYSALTPWGIDGTDEMDEAGTHHDGMTARTFLVGEEITLDDVRVAAYENLDADAADRIDDYLWITDPDGSPVGIALFPIDANWFCRKENKKSGIKPYNEATPNKYSSSYMSKEGISRPLDFSSFSYAVLAKYPSSSEWVLAGALDTLEHAETIAGCHRMNHEETARDGVLIKEIKK